MGDFHLPWNHINLPTPAILSIALTCQNSYEVVAEMKICINSMKQTFHDFKQMDVEAAALSRLIYQLKLKLRHEKSIKVLQKINRCLTNYKTLNVPFIMSSIEETLDVSCGPSRQMLEWVLVRIYGIAQLFHRVTLLCIEAVGHLFVKIKLGQLWNMTLIPIAVCSRLWTISQFILCKSCEWYNNLYPYLDKMEASASPLLPQGCDLPQNLDLTLSSTSSLHSTSLNLSLDNSSELKVDAIASEKLRLARGTLSGNDRVADIGVRVSRVSFDEFCIKERQQICENPKYNQLSSKPYCTKPKSLNSLNNISFHTMDLNHTKSTKVNTILSNNFSAKKGSNKHKALISKTVHDTKSSLDTSTKSVRKLYKHSIKAIESSDDLKQFLNYENHLQHKYHNIGDRSEKPIIRKGGTLQWLPMKHYIKEQLRLIKKSEKSGKSDEKEKILQALKVYIKKRV